MEERTVRVEKVLTRNGTFFKCPASLDHDFFFECVGLGESSCHGYNLNDIRQWAFHFFFSLNNLITRVTVRGNGFELEALLIFNDLIVVTDNFRVKVIPARRMLRENEQILD